MNVSQTFFNMIKILFLFMRNAPYNNFNVKRKSIF